MTTKSIVAFTATTTCDACEADLTLYTDGINAYAVAPDERFEVTNLARDGVRVTAECPRDLPGWDTTCGGQYLWTLDTHDSWTTDRVVLSMIGYGEKMDVA